jgi:hypothetical protein
MRFRLSSKRLRLIVRGADVEGGLVLRVESGEDVDQGGEPFGDVDAAKLWVSSEQPIKLGEGGQLARRVPHAAFASFAI